MVYLTKYNRPCLPHQIPNKYATNASIVFAMNRIVAQTANSIALIWVQLPPWVWARLSATIQQITNGDTVHIMLENRKLDVQRSKRGRRAQLKHLERRNVPSPQLISKWKLKPGMQRKAVKRRSRLWKEVSCVYFVICQWSECKGVAGHSLIRWGGVVKRGSYVPWLW